MPFDFDEKTDNDLFGTLANGLAHVVTQLWRRYPHLMVPEDGGKIEVLNMYTFEIVQYSCVEVVMAHTRRAAN